MSLLSFSPRTRQNSGVCHHTHLLTCQYLNSGPLSTQQSFTHVQDLNSCPMSPMHALHPQDHLLSPLTSLEGSHRLSAAVDKYTQKEKYISTEWQFWHFSEWTLGFIAFVLCQGAQTNKGMWEIKLLTSREPGSDERNESQSHSTIRGFDPWLP